MCRSVTGFSCGRRAFVCARIHKARRDEVPSNHTVEERLFTRMSGLKDENIMFAWITDRP